MRSFDLIRKDGTVFPLNNSAPYRGVIAAQQNPKWQVIEKLPITIRSATPIDFRIGDRIVAYGRPYEIFTAVSAVRLSGEFSSIEYVVPFFSPEKHLETTTFFATDENLEYLHGYGEEPPMVGTLEYYGKQLCHNVHRNKGRKIFKLGEIPAIPEGADLLKKSRYIEFTDYNCMACLTQICEEFKTFYTIRPNPEGDSDYLLDFGREVGEFPATLSQGVYNGLYSLENTAVDDKGVVTKLLVLGSDKNLPAEHPFPRLRLPARYVGSIIFDQAKIDQWGAVEGRYDSEVYPTRLGTVTGIFQEGQIEDHLYSFIDSTLNIEPERLTSGGKVAMISGWLAGFNFEIKRFDPVSKRVTIAPLKDGNGFVTPSHSYIFGVGDEYHLIDISMPSSYLIAAQENMAIDGEEYYEKISQPQVTYQAAFDKLYLREMGVVPEVGMLIPIHDTRLGIDKKIRLTAYSRDLLKSEYDLQSVQISDIKTESLAVKLYKSAVRSANKLKYAGLNDPSNSPTSGFAALQNSLAQKFGYKDYDALVKKFGGDRSIITEAMQYDEDGNPIGLIDMIRAGLIDVHSLAANNVFAQFLAANKALIDNLLVRSLETVVNSLGYRARLFNEENILWFEKMVNGVSDPNNYAAIGAPEGFPPQATFMSDKLRELGGGNLPVGTFGTSVKAGQITIGEKTGGTQLNPIMDTRMMLSVWQINNEYRSMLMLRGLPTNSSPGAGAMYRLTLGSSLHIQDNY